MPSFTLSTASAVARTLFGGEAGIVTANGSLVTSGDAVTISHTAASQRSSLFVLGAIHSLDGEAIESSGTAGSLEIVVGSLGSVTSSVALRAAINVFFATDFLLSNAGLVSGTQALVLNGSSGTETARIGNTGSILGLGNGAPVIATNSLLENLTITNAGTIMTSAADSVGILHRSTAGTLSIDNTGTIAALGRAVQTQDILVLDNAGEVTGGIAFGIRASVVNTGLIQGSLSRTEAVGTQATTIDNAGRITGAISLGAGEDVVRNTGTIGGAVQLDGGSNRLENIGGTIMGPVTMAGGNDLVINAGLISGDVSLGLGQDVFDGRGGRVSGIVFGGGGDDVFHTDRSDAAFRGEAGLDTVISTANFRLSFGTELLVLEGPTGLRGIGSTGNETILGGAGDDTLLGAAGQDLLDGGLGDDRLDGGDGDDVLRLSEGADALFGGAGTDTLDTSGFEAPAIIELAPGRASIAYGAGGTAHSATLRGIEDATGGAGADTITGSVGANRLDGGAGDDSINAAGGNDTIIGGAGRDTLLGAGGVDVFAYLAIADSTPDAPDLLRDFSRAEEVIDLSAIDADPLTAGDQGFAFLASAAFNGTGAQLRVFADAPAGLTRVEVRLAGSTTNDMLITLTGFGVFTVDNFLL